jgi:hypothetical protein
MGWNKDEVIAAVKTEIGPATPGYMNIKPVALYAFARLALGKPAGRASPVADCVIRPIAGIDSDATRAAFRRSRAVR